MRTADLCSTDLPNRSNMHLAPIIERYMDLMRQESAVYSDFDLMELRTSVSAREYDEVSALLSANIGLLRDPDFSALSQLHLYHIAVHEAELAAMNALLLEKWEKTQEMQKKSTYSARPHTKLKVSVPTSRVLTSSVMEIKRKKDEIKVLLQQL